MKKFNRNVNPQSIEAYAKVCQLVSCPSCSGCSCGPEFGILGYNKISSAVLIPIPGAAIQAVM